MYIDEANSMFNNGEYVDAELLSDPVIYSLIVADPCESMAKLKNLSEEFRRCAILLYPPCVEFIEDITDDLQLYALECRWYLSFYNILMEDLERNDETYFNNEIKKMKLKYGSMVE